MPKTGTWQQLLTLKLGPQKMLPKQDGFPYASELFPCLAFATESVNELFTMSYLNLFKSVLGYLSPLSFFLAFCYTVSLTTFVTYNNFLLQNCGRRKKICFNI